MDNMSIAGGTVNYYGATLANIKLLRVGGNGTFVDEVRINANDYVVVWNGSEWIAPSGGTGTLPTGTANSMLVYNSTTSTWANQQYLTYTGNKLKLQMGSTTTVYAELAAASSTIGTYLRLQTSTTKYALLSGGAFPNLQLIGDTSGSLYAIKVGNSSVQYFTVTNQGDVVGKSLKLTTLNNVTTGDIACIDANNYIARMSPSALLTMLGINGIVQFDPHTVFVSPGGFNNPSTDNRYFGSINGAITYIQTQGGTIRWNVIVYPDLYDESFTVPANVSVVCASGAVFSSCSITLMQGARFLGEGDLPYGGGAIIRVVTDNVNNTAITVVEGNTLAIYTVGIPLHIRCNTLTELVATITNNYGTATIVSKLDIRVECLNIIKVVTTVYPFSQLMLYNAAPYLQADNMYCQCKWRGTDCTCEQSVRCLMNWYDIDSENYRVASDSRITIRTNTRDQFSEFFLSVGKISIFGLVHEDELSTPATYITSSTYGSEDVPRTQLNVHGFRENHTATLGTAYQVANEGTLVIDSCNIRVANGGTRAIYQRIGGTTYTCRTSIKNSYIEGGAYDIESATSDRLAINSSIGRNGENGNTIILGTWSTGTGIDWI